MIENVRVEQKYLITEVEMRKSRAYFEQLLHRDTHNQEEGYVVRSIYFDTPCNQDYCDKGNGIEMRKKIRLRIYENSVDYAFLEMKQKDGMSQRKRTLKISKEHAQQMCNAEYACLLSYEEEFAIECYAIMCSEVYRPKVVVEYNRYAFVTQENKTRITFDSNVRAAEGQYDLFSKEIPFVPIIDPSLVVLEVKYNGFLLSVIQDVIQNTNKSTISVSKYFESRKLRL